MRYEKKLTKLRKARDDLRAKYSEELKQLKWKKSDWCNTEEYGFEFQMLSHEAWDQERWSQFSIDDYITDELTAEAELLLLPVPPRTNGKFWVDADLAATIKFLILTPEGIVHIRDMIRKEKSARREETMVYINAAAKLVVMLTGLTGAVIGLVAALKN